MAFPTGYEGEVDGVHLGGPPVKKVGEFKYQGFVVQSNGNIDADVIHRIMEGWGRWTQVSSVANNVLEGGVLVSQESEIECRGEGHARALEYHWSLSKG